MQPVRPVAPTSFKRIAVIGASGYGGLQTLRLLQDHPHFDVSFLGGERSAGKRWSELTPFLPLGEDLVVQGPDPDAIADAADAAATPCFWRGTIIPSLSNSDVVVFLRRGHLRARSGKVPPRLPGVLPGGLGCTL